MITAPKGYWLCANCSPDNLIYNPDSDKTCRTCGQKPTQTLKIGGTVDLKMVVGSEIPKPLKQGKKARSQKWAYKGMILDSTDEKDRYLYLEAMQERGIISELSRPTAIETRPKLIVPNNSIHSRFEQRREVYTPDFAYRWGGYFILEDVKGKRFTKKLKNLKPRLHHGDANKIRDLQAILVKHPKRVFLLTVYHSGYWHYFNSNQTQIEFSLEQLNEDAA